VVHDEAAAVPEVEGRDGEGGAVAAEGEALGEPLLDPEPRRLLERGGELRHDPPLRHERVHGARRRHGLRGQGSRALVLLPDPAREADEDARVHEARDDEQQHGRQRHQRELPHESEPDGVAADEQGDVHQEVGHLLAQRVQHDEAVVGHAGHHVGHRAGLEVEELHVLPENRLQVPRPHPLRRPRPAVSLVRINYATRCVSGVRVECVSRARRSGSVGVRGCDVVVVCAARSPWCACLPVLTEEAATSGGANDSHGVVEQVVRIMARRQGMEVAACVSCASFVCFSLLASV
jgi:hypothetical protein